MAAPYPRSGTFGETLGWLIALAAMVALPFLAPGYYVQFTTKVLLMGLAAMALNLAVGFGGMVSMCHAAFFGLSGYVFALATPRYDPAPIWWTLPLAVGAAALAALVIGALSLRTRGVYFIMVTLAFGQMLFHLFHDTTLAGGSDGAYIYTRPEVALFGVTLLDLDRPNAFYFLVLAIVTASVLFLTRLTRSPFGQALAAAHHNERRTLSLGFPVYAIRLAAFVISGALVGVAGYFAAAQFGFVAPQMLGWHLSATILVMVVLGGLSSVTGPLLGAALLLGLEEVLKSATEYWAIVEGGIILAIVLAVPGGTRDVLRIVVGSGPLRAPFVLASGSGKPPVPVREAGPA